MPPLRLLLPFLATAALAVASAAQQPPAAKSWRGWDQYQTLMWSTGGVREFDTWTARLKELGCTGEELSRGGDPAPYLRSGLGFYVENLVNELAHLHDRKALYDEDFKGYTATRDRKYLVRKPCFDDPAPWAEQERRVADYARKFGSQHPLAYDLRDELSIGTFASPMDYCFCPKTLAAFRDWLKARYGTLEALNAEWDTRFAAWEQVEPLTTYEIKDRERAALAQHRPENFAPWADHREYMDVAFARTLDRLRSAIRKVDPDTPVGVEGTQMPSAWGGYDLWRLSRAVDWIEPYDIAGSREVLRSFIPEGAPVMGTVFGSDFPRLRLHLWRLLLHGDRGCIVWDDEKSRSIEKDAPGMPLTARGKGLAEIFAELRRVGPELMRARRLDDKIAIHYSQASIRAHWMFDSREDKDTWPRRFSSYEATHSRFARVRDSFVRVVEDLGLQYQFLSYEQLERGDLVKQGYRVLLLPQSVAMSPAECEQVRAFVRAGGTVIADNMTATMDAHGKRLPTGQLDDLFGIRRSSTDWRPRGEGGTVTPTGAADPVTVFEREVVTTTGQASLAGGRAPALIVHREGKGRAVYLNVDMHDYGAERLRPGWGGAGLRQVFGSALRDAGVRPVVQVARAADGSPAACVEVWRYQAEGRELVAVTRNPEMRASSLGPVGYTGNAAIEKPEQVRITLPRRARVRDLRTGRDLGSTDRVETELDPWSPTILELR